MLTIVQRVFLQCNLVFRIGIYHFSDNTAYKITSYCPKVYLSFSAKRVGHLSSPAAGLDGYL